MPHLYGNEPGNADERQGQGRVSGPARAIAGRRHPGGAAIASRTEKTAGRLRRLCLSSRQERCRRWWARPTARAAWWFRRFRARLMRVLLFKNGSELLGKLPVVPGLERQLLAPIPNDDQRLGPKASSLACRRSCSTGRPRENPRRHGRRPASKRSSSTRRRK